MIRFVAYAKIQFTQVNCLQKEHSQ